jgi:hypothetical protein
MSRSSRTWFVTIIGWLGIGFGLMTLATGALMAWGFDKFLSGPDLDADITSVATDPRVPALAAWSLTHLSFFVYATVAFGLAVVGASIAMLLRRNWGRLGVLATLWLGIAANLAIATLTVVLVLAIPDEGASKFFSELGGDFQRVAWGLVATVVGGVTMVVALHAWIIQQLSGADARREFGID